jgi:hypothetical protein
MTTVIAQTTEDSIPKTSSTLETPTVETIREDFDHDDVGLHLAATAKQDSEDALEEECQVNASCNDSTNTNTNNKVEIASATSAGGGSSSNSISDDVGLDSTKIVSFNTESSKFKQCHLVLPLAAFAFVVLIIGFGAGMGVARQQQDNNLDASVSDVHCTSCCNGVPRFCLLN